jgi:hypothetical protein
MSVTPSFTLADAQAEIAQALQPLTVLIEGLQVYGFMNTNPTPPSLDVFPGDPFQTGAGFRAGSTQVWFTVRARVSTADQEAGQKLLLRLLDTHDVASVENALADTATVTVEGVSGFREYLEDSASNGRLLGCEWRVTLFL